MSYKTGGEIEKGGNQYESLVLVYYFAKLLNDDILFVQSESYEAELEKGTDIIIKTRDDNIFVVQAKSRDGIDDVWDINKLKKHSIIKNACHHISNGRDFHLVSPLDFTALKDLCKQSQSFDDFRLFEKFIFRDNPKSKVAVFFEKIVKEIKTNFADEDALRFFHHFYVDFLPDYKQFFIDNLASCGKINEAKHAFSLLDHYPTKLNRLGRPIYVTEIHNYLKEHKITFYNINNQAASLTLINLQDKFINNLQRKLINQTWHERNEFNKLNYVLKNQNVAIISGQAGTGKSALIYKLCKELQNANKIFLPLSFEVSKPNNNLYEYGKALGFTASPIEILKNLSNGETCYLIIDQVDAIKWEQTDWNSAFDACCTIVEEISKVPNLKIIFACRTIDADKILKFWNSDAPKLSSCQILLSKLSVDYVKNIVGSQKYERLSNSLREMLRNPNNLKLYTELCAKENYVPTVNLIKDYIDYKQQELIKKGFSESSVFSFLNCLIDELKRTNSTTIYEYKVNENFSSDLINAYCSAGIIEITDNSLIKFTHQSILDYYFAKDLLNSLDSGRSIVKVIRQYNKNPLGNLDVIKQFLESCYNRKNYLDYLENIIFSKQIRMIIKNTAIRALRTLGPNDKTNKLYMKVLRSKQYGMKYLYFLSDGNRNFSSYFIKQKEFNNLLISSDFNDNLHAINLLLQADNVETTKILSDYVSNISDERILRSLIHNIDDIDSCDELFAIKIELLKKTINKSYYIDWSKILSGPSERIKQYLIVFLINDNLDIDNIDATKVGEQIVKAVATDYNYFYKLSKTKVESVFTYELDFDNIAQYDCRKNLYATIFETSLLFISFDELFSLFYSDRKFYKHSALRAILNYDFNYGLKALIKLIKDGYISKQNYFHDRKLLEIICRLISKYANDLPEKQFRVLENQIINYKSPSVIEFAKERFAQRRLGYYYHFCEEEQKRFLECLPQEKLAKKSQNYLVYLSRKFPKNEYYVWVPEMDQATGYTVVSCIAKKWQQFSAKVWHQLMSNPKTGQKERSKMTIDENGQAVEATMFEFCSTINTAVRVKPKTFVELALQFDDLRLPFIEAICEGLYDGNVEGVSPNEICTAEQKLLVYKKYFNIENKKILRSFVWFIERNDIMNPWIYERLIEIVKNPDKYEHNDMNTWSSNWNHDMNTLTTRDLDTEKINRIQTCAVNCLANTLFDKKDLPVEIESILSECINSSHPVVLLSTIDILYPIWNFNKDFVVNNMVDIFNKDIRLLSAIKSLNLLQHVIQNYHESFKEIFLTAIKANNKDFENLYRIIIIAYCHYGYYKELVTLLSANFSNLCLTTCTQILINNDSADILERARNVIITIQDFETRSENPKNQMDSIFESKLITDKKNQNLILRAIKSKAFFNDSFSEYRFISSVKESSNLISLKKIIITYVNTLLRARDYISIEIDELIHIIIGLHREAVENKQKALSRKCLNLLDKIYSNFVIVRDIEYLKDIS
ncbi:MAG: hypothetical protein NC131_12560 [Roseburia sp.]|nr:hypothetical protein [Roseburia sp.]